MWPNLQEMENFNGKLYFLWSGFSNYVKKYRFHVPIISPENRNQHNFLKLHPFLSNETILIRTYRGLKLGSSIAFQNMSGNNLLRYLSFYKDFNLKMETLKKYIQRPVIAILLKYWLFKYHCTKNEVFH